MKAKLPSALALFSTVVVLWSLAAPRAAAFPSRADYYKVSLFGAPGALSLVAAALFTVLAIVLVRANVASALAVIASSQVSISGSGITAATISATLAMIAACLTALPQKTELAE